MNISLTADLEAFIKIQVDSGLYNNSSEVMRSALRLLKEQSDLHEARIKQLNVEISRGLEQLNSGQVLSSEQAWNRIKLKTAKDAKI